MQIFFKKNFLSLQECTQLNSWVKKGVEEKWLDAGISRNSEWSYLDRVTTRNYGDRFNYPEIAHQIFNKITDYLGLHDAPKSVIGGGKNGIVVSCTFPNGDVYLHKDPMEGELHVLRCNVMTQAADCGAELFIGNKKIDISVGDLHCYLPSNVEHYVTKVDGNTPRIMWMFGYQVSIKQFNTLQESWKTLKN
jgi:hypothetical protein